MRRRRVIAALLHVHLQVSKADDMGKEGAELGLAWLQRLPDAVVHEGRVEMKR